MILDKRQRESVDPVKQVNIAFNILNYNQNLIQFADSKANALLLINSIFIASLGAFLPSLKTATNPLVGGILLLFLVSSIISILLALAVIMTRRAGEVENRNRSLIFYGHIIESPSPEGFIHEFSHEEIEHFRDATLANTYVLARIAATKFATYSSGQTMTLISCLLWITCILMALVS
jgi:hypothetical protein